MLTHISVPWILLIFNLPVQCLILGKSTQFIKGFGARIPSLIASPFRLSHVGPIVYKFRIKPYYNLTENSLLIACMWQFGQYKLGRGLIHACHAGGVVHFLEGWTHHEVGAIEVDRMDVVWEAAHKHGIKPV